MKILRSTKCSLKFATKKKLAILEEILEEYNKVVNFYINCMWPQVHRKNDLHKLFKLNEFKRLDTWLTYDTKNCAARQAIDLIKTSQEIKPKYIEKQMHLFTKNIQIKEAKTKKFDVWIQIGLQGKSNIQKYKNIKLCIPIKFHKHYHKLKNKGKRLNSYIIDLTYIQFAFEIETGPKRETGTCIGIDTGINTLATLSNEEKYGQDIKQLLVKIKRCKWGSKHQKRLRRALRQRMDEVAKEIAEKEPRLIVVEKFKNLNKNTKVKRRLNKTMRRFLGSWNYRYWLDRVQRACEDNCVSFRSVYPAYTSQQCSVCGHTEKGNRSGGMFKCQKCDYTDDADVNAAKNILDRFLSGPYGAGFKPESMELVA